MPKFPVVEIIDGYWRRSNQADPVAYALYEQHYSFNPRKERKSKQFMGAGQQLVLMALDGTALFGWKVEGVHPDGRSYRRDGQIGIECCIFRRTPECTKIASWLIESAMKAAWQRWPDKTRMFTYINAGKIASVNPGYCFKKCGWVNAGVSGNGKILLEALK